MNFFSFFKFDSFDFYFLCGLIQLIDICHDSRRLNVHEHERRNNFVAVDGVESASRTAWIDVEFVFVLVCFKLVRVTGDEDVNI